MRGLVRTLAALVILGVTETACSNDETARERCGVGASCETTTVSETFVSAPSLPTSPALTVLQPALTEPTTTEAPPEPADEVYTDAGMECGIADLSPSLIATVSGVLDEAIVAAPEIGRGFFASSLQIDSVDWQSTAAEQLAVAQLSQPIAAGNSYPIVLFGDGTMIARFEELLDGAADTGDLIVVGLSSVGVQTPRLRLLGTVSADAFKSPSGCDAQRTAQLQNVARFTGTSSLATALAVLTDEVQLRAVDRPGPIEQSAYGPAEHTPTT